jgi:hypothetical protein
MIVFLAAARPTGHGQPARRSAGADKHKLAAKAASHQVTGDLFRPRITNGRARPGTETEGDGIAANRTAHSLCAGPEHQAGPGKVRGDERIERDFNTTTWSRNRNDSP